MQRKLWALLAMLSVLCFAGVGHTGKTVSGKVRLMDYVQQTGLVLGYPDGQPPLGWYHRTNNTVFAPGPPSVFFPPSPCRGLGRAWNVIVNLKPRRGVGALLQRKALERILTQMTKHECNAIIDRNASGVPSNIVKISPTP